MKKTKRNNINNDKKFLDNYRNVDNFPLNFLSKSYKNITNYLTSKYYMKKDKISLINSDSKNNSSIKTVKLYYQNINQRWIELIKKDLKGIVNVELDQINPDYYIYATFGCEYLNNTYNNSIKIAFFTENQLPDLDYADYAIGLSHINYLDRYFILPYLVYYFNSNNLFIDNITKARENAIKYHNRTKFCAAVISNGFGLRIFFINELNKYKTVDMGGRHHNNIGGNVRNKIEFLSSYKFSIGMENSEADGYATEKIIDSYLAGTIPIYYGDYTIDEYINPKSYILIRDRDDIQEKIEYIKKIDNDDELYQNILKEKVFIDDNFLEKISEERRKFIINIFEQRKDLAKRRDNYHSNFF